MGLRHLWLLVPFFAAAARSWLPIGDNSFLWHVRSGVDQLTAGEVLRTDPYSFTRLGEPWRTQSWLADLLYGQLETWFAALRWVPWFSFLAASLVLGLVLALVFSRRGSLTSVGVAIVLFGWILMPYANPRPVVLSYALFALLSMIIVSNGRFLWAVPGLMWLWASVHGSFIVGIGLLAMDAVRLRSRRHAGALALGLVGASMTAHGVGVWEILYRFAANRRGLDFILEWQPPNFQSPWLLPFVATIGILMVGLAAQRIRQRDLWLIVPIVAFGLLSSRNVMPAIVLLMPWVGEGLAPLRRDDEIPRGDLRSMVTAGLLVVVSVVAVSLPPRLNSERFPADAMVDALEPGPAFHTMGTGGYLIYAAADDRRVFVDDRVELYGPDFLGVYLDASFGVTWRELFAEWQLEQALLANASALLTKLVEDGWQVCRADDHFSVVAVDCP